MAPVSTTESDFEQKLQEWMNDLREFSGRAVLTPSTRFNLQTPHPW